MFSYWTARDVTETLSTPTNTRLPLVTSTRFFLVSLYQFINSQKIKLISSEVDGSPEEIDESIDRLHTLGFTEIENKEISEGNYFPGKRNWLGSVMVFTKEIQS